MAERPRAGGHLYDLKVIGAQELQSKLNALGRTQQRRVMSRIVRSGAHRSRDRVVRNLSGAPVQVRTGRLRQGFQKAPIRQQARVRGLIRIGFAWPTRDILGIDPDDKAFYPTAVEYGHKHAPAYPYLRPAIDDHKTAEYTAMRIELRRLITHVWRTGKLAGA